MRSGQKIPTVDLFSGIGGFAFALRSLCRTVAYCEIDPKCQRVLQYRMQRGDLDDAQVHENVITLPKLKGGPKLLTAGFPCQDVSVMSASGSEGLFGSRTGLFFEILKTLEKNPSIDVVLLENSSNLLNRGWEHVVDGLERRGFTEICWSTFTASEVGGLHRRTRLYCLACRPTKCAKMIIEVLEKCPFPELSYDWADDAKGKEPCPRLVTRTDTHTNRMIKDRCRMLGNSVVPACVVYAVRELSRSLSNSQRGPMKTKRPPPFKIVPSRDRVASDEHGTRITHARWMTPTYKGWHQYRILTDRGSRLLSNQIFYDTMTHHFRSKKVSVNDRDKHFSINPTFIEYLMGFPLHWTTMH